MKRLMLTVVLVFVAAFALTACATGNEESGTATASALQSTNDAVSTQMGATAAVAQSTLDAESAAATAAIADAQTTADAAAATAAGQPTDEATEAAATVVPPTEAVATEAATAEEATAEATVEEAAPTEEAQAATEEPTAEATAEEAAPTEEPTVEATVEEATVEATVEDATEEPEATEAPEEATAEPEATSDVATTEGVTTVCLVTDLGRVNDGSFNQSAYEGMLRAEADFGLTTKYIETQAQTDYEANIATCLDEGFDVVVTVGFLIYDATVAAAKANPDVYFIGVDQFPAEAVPNFVGIQFREDQAGFLAGAMAALMTESNKVGGVYGVEIPPVVKFRNGFEQGVRHINPDIELFGVYIPDFIAPQLGAETAEAFIAEGVDVVFGAGGPTGSGGIVRAAELGAWVIGVDKDEYLSTFGEGETPGADRIITSAVKRVDNGVYDMIAAVVEGGAGFPADSLYLMDASIDGVGFAPAHDAAVPEEVTEQVQAIFEELAAGTLETGVDPVTGALLDGGEVTEDATAEATEEGTTEEATTEPEATAAEEATEEPVAEATEAPAEPTADPAVAQATTEARQARATQRAEAAAAATTAAGSTTEEATAEPEATEEGTTEEATAEPEATSDVATTEGVTTVCLVTDLGRVNDGSFNQSAYEGMLRAEADLGLTTKYIETQAQTDYEANIATCLDEGFDVVVTVGFLIYDATIAAAKANPDVYFIGVDQFPAEAVPNFVGIQFREDQAGYLAGAMAALMTESNKVGGVYGIEIPPVVKFRNGFEQGVRHINPDIELFGVYIPDFVAPQLGAETAEAFIAEGVDVVFGAGGPTGSGGIVRAAELGAWVIGVDKDEYLSTFGEGETPGADRIITSAVKRVDNGVYDMIAAVVEGGAGFPADSLYLMDASIDGVGFAPAHDAAVPEEVTEQVQAIFEELAAGTLETGVDPVTGALLDGETEATEEGEEAEATAEATAAP